jgi:hypothetical protein
MDPFFESQEWQDFHHSAIDVMREQLTSNVSDRYVIRIERRIYIEHPDEPEADLVIADVAIAHRSGGREAVAFEAERAPFARPVTCLVAMPEERRESYLVIKDLEADRVVTVAELLSPSNKRRGSGRRKYLSKREEVLGSATHLVEIDLLRGGTRMPMRSPLPPGDYYAIVSNARRRPRSDVYPWRLAERLPCIPVPLAKGNSDIPLDLQRVLDTAYDRARYDRMLNYAAPLVPPADADTQRWIDDVLTSKGIACRPPAGEEPPAENTAS